MQAFILPRLFVDDPRAGVTQSQLAEVLLLLCLYATGAASAWCGSRP